MSQKEEKIQVYGRAAPPESEHQLLPAINTRQRHVQVPPFPWVTAVPLNGELQVSFTQNNPRTVLL